MYNLKIIYYKYNKYKTKYIQLSKLIGGVIPINDVFIKFTTGKLIQQSDKPNPGEKKRKTQKLPIDRSHLNREAKKTIYRRNWYGK